VYGGVSCQGPIQVVLAKKESAGTLNERIDLFSTVWTTSCLPVIQDF
jgi:hypothetical protein